MGRISEALKRAERERDHRLAAQATMDPERVARAVPEPTPTGGDVLAQMSVLDMPAPPKPFEINRPAILADSVDGRVVALHDPSGEIAEKYRSVRTRLLTNNPTGCPRTHVVTSSIAKEGKTVTTANLAFSLAELRHLRVAAVDLDFRSRGLSRLLGKEDQPGVAEVIRGEKALSQVCIPAVRENLYFVPAGDPGEDGAADLLTHPGLKAMLRELNERFHYSLLDAPSVQQTADIGLIGPLCHSVLLVVRMNRTPESLVSRSVKTLQANRVSIAGCILAGHRDAGGVEEWSDMCQRMP